MLKSAVTREKSPSKHLLYFFRAEFAVLPHIVLPTNTIFTTCQTEFAV